MSKAKLPNTRVLQGYMRQNNMRPILLQAEVLNTRVLQGHKPSWCNQETCEENFHRMGVKCETGARRLGIKCEHLFMEENFREVCYHLAFVQTVRNLYNAWRLHELGFGTPDFDVTKSAEVEAILKEVGLAGQYESFFESGPQSITQCVIILSTGKISATQMFSITISVASLTWGAGRSFFIQREAHMLSLIHI